MLDELKTFFLAMLPITELRGAIPIALGIYQLPVWSAYLWAVLGNLAPAIFLLWFLESISRWLSHHIYFFNRFFVWLFERTRRRHNHRFELWGEIALVAFVAIPLPMTGVWTASVAAFVFGIPFKKALSFIALGASIAGLIVSFISLGVLKLI